MSSPELRREEAARAVESDRRRRVALALRLGTGSGERLRPGSLGPLLLGGLVALGIAAAMGLSDLARFGPAPR